MPKDSESKNRPDWITCIQHTHYAKRGTTWCGRSVTEFTFNDIDHAAYNGLSGGRLLACRECVKAISVTLERG